MRGRRLFAAVDPSGWAQTLARLALVLLVATTAFASSPALPPEFNPRGGLPHVSSRLAAGEAVRVAFLGGSITAVNGWRPGIFAHLRQTYPENKFIEIFAAIPGTGSDFGAARLHDDVLRHAPDLLFVEFAVNDGGRAPDAVRRSMEGIVRQTRRASPKTDLCFVYTLSSSGLPDMENGRYPAPAAAMEEVAVHYGVPSAHFGVEVVRRIRAGTLAFTGEPLAPNTEVFTADGSHPTPSGHRLYTEILVRGLTEFLAVPASIRKPLPAPLEAAHWEGARLRPLGEIAVADTWTALPADDARFASITSVLRRPTWSAESAGPVLEFTFTGTAFGLAGLKGPDAGQFRVTVDNRAPIIGTFFDSYSLAGRYRVRPWFYPGELPPGPHTVRVELLVEGPNKAAILRRTPDSLATDPDFAHNVLTASDLILVEPAP